MIFMLWSHADVVEAVGIIAGHQIGPAAFVGEIEFFIPHPGHFLAVYAGSQLITLEHQGQMMPGGWSEAVDLTGREGWHLQLVLLAIHHFNSLNRCLNRPRAILLDDQARPRCSPHQ